METPRFQWRWFWLGLLGLVALWLLWRLWHVLLPFFLAAGIAYLINPQIDRLEAEGLSRNRAILLILLVLLVLVALLGFLVVPLLTAEITNIVENYDTLVQQSADLYQSSLAWVQAKFPWTQTHAGLPATIRVKIADYINMLLTRAPALLTSLLKSIAAFILLLLLTSILSFGILKEYHAIGSRLLAFVPSHYKSTAISLNKQINQLVSVYLGGQLILAAIAAVVATLILFAFKVNYALLIGFLVGALYLIPYVGVPVAIIISVIVSAITGNSWINIVGMVGCFIVLNILMDYVVSPRVIGSRVQLHPMTILFAVVAAGELLGFLGVFIAVPLAAAIKAILATFFPEFFSKAPVPIDNDKSTTPAD